MHIAPESYRNPIPQLPSPTQKRERGIIAWLLGTLLAGVLVAVIAAPARAQSSDTPQRLIVHEWGVLTAIASPATGRPIKWLPLEILLPQPSFVEQYPQDETAGVVRMDVPAVFFRVDKPLSVTMSLQCLDGHFCSGYPWGDKDAHSLTWNALNIMPTAQVALLDEASPSHYYEARNTAASFVRADHDGHKQYERFLQFRGLGNLDLPLEVKVNQEEFTITQAPDAPVPFVLLIENQEGKLGYAQVDLVPANASAQGSLALPRLKLTANVDLVNARLRKILNQQGMYPDEASAAVGGIRRDWLGPGVRAIYFLPRSELDRQLPMAIKPAPTEHLRLYAVCMELVTPRMREQIMNQLAALNPEDTASHIRFMRSSPLIRPTLEQLLEEMTRTKGDKAPQDAARQGMHDKIALLLKN